MPATDLPRILNLSTATRRTLLRHLAATALFISLAVLATACGSNADSSGNNGDGVVVVPAGSPDTASSVTSGATSEPGNGADPTATIESVSETLSGFAFPIVGGCLPTGDQLMPNAPREYRNGTHEGVDFYNVDNCTAIGIGTPIGAAKRGVVIRADHDYLELTAERYAELAADLTSAESLDAFRGRQVWVDHGNGVITRYCHLNAIADGLVPGSSVAAGDLVGFVGESGTPESINNPGSQYHLHFEVRIGESYPGAGMPADEVRTLYSELFSQ